MLKKKAQFNKMHAKKWSVRQSTGDINEKFQQQQKSSFFSSVKNQKISHYLCYNGTWHTNAEWEYRQKVTIKITLWFMVPTYRNI